MPPAMLYSCSRRPEQMIRLYLLAVVFIIALPLLYYHSTIAVSLSSSWNPHARLPPDPALVNVSWRAARVPHPAEFLTDYHLSPDQAMCDRMYGRGYFTHIDSHQHPYCEPSSSSFLQCFSAPRLPAPWASQWSSEAGDPICIAQGVSFDRDGGERYFKAHCNARDFGVEQSRMKEHGYVNPVDPSSTDLSGVPNLAELAEYWGGSGVGGEFKHRWDFTSTVAGCTKDANNGEWLFVIKREVTPNIWHALMNLWQAMVTLDAMQVALNPATGKPWMSAEDIASMDIVWDDNESLQGLEDWWLMLNGKKPGRTETLPSGTCYGNVLIPLAGLSSPMWAALSETVYHELCQEPFLIDALRRRVFRHLGLTPRAPRFQPNEHPTITLVNRTHNRKLWDADGLMAKVRARYPESKVNVVDFGSISLREQVALAADTDVFIGHHGAGLMHLLFLPSDAAVVEITSSRARKFRTITRLRGIAHFEADCLEEPEYGHIVNGTPLPEGWRAGADDQHWQSREYAYLIEDDFLGWVDAAVRNQKNKRYERR